MIDSSVLSRWQMPRLDAEERWLGGVASAIAVELGVQALVIRASFVVLAIGGGWGLIFYAACWAIFIVSSADEVAGVYDPAVKGKSSFHRNLAILLIVISLLMITQSIDFGPFGDLAQLDDLVWPVGFVVVGSLIAWAQGRDYVGGLASVARIGAGVAIAMFGLTFFSFSLLGDTLSILIAVVVVVVIIGSAIVVGPSLIRMGNTIDLERSERIRSDERAQVAAHLHDSVLQTLSLIQRHSDEPTEVVKLARQQERELRGWLYGAKPATPGSTRIGPALEEAASSVETTHGVPIEVVSVGDVTDYQPEEVEGIVAAAREAMVNASIHSGANKVDVFVESSPDAIEVFVRDNGSGFDPAQVAADRQGLRESVQGRMRRLGGSATVDSELGAGTDVELHLPLKRAPKQTSLETTFAERSTKLKGLVFRNQESGSHE